MIIKTTYSNSLSFTPNMVQKMQDAEVIDVYHKRTGAFIISLPATVVIDGAKQIPFEHRDGTTRMSYFRVFNFKHLMR